MTSLRIRVQTVTIASLAITGLLSTSALASPGTSSSPEAQAPVVFSAAGWGTTARTNPPIAASGRTALATLGCTRQIGLIDTNQAAGVSLPDLGEVGALMSEASTSRSGNKYSSIGFSNVASASLLGGEVDIEGIDTTATASKDGNGFHAKVTTTITSVTIGGVPVELTGPEQVINIPGVAKLTLAHSETSKSAHRSTASGTAVTLEVLSSGAVVKIGNATASVDDRQIDAQFGGGAYTSLVTVNGKVDAGKTAVKHMPCQGTFGEDKSNSTLATDLGDLGTIGVTKSTVNATAKPLPDATVTAEVADASIVVPGVATIEITGVKAQAHATEDADGHVTTDIGATMVGSIKVKPVAGAVITIPIPADPNTSVELPLGLGSIDFLTTKNSHHGRGLRVVGLQIHLPLIDSNVTLASATVRIR